MSTVLQMTSPNPLKRCYESTEVAIQSHHSDQCENGLSDKLFSQMEQEESSPAIIKATVTITEETPHTSRAISPSRSAGPFTNATGSPPKKRKLTASEKEARRLEKEQKDQQKAAEKARKDEEKARKDGEKRIKDEGRKAKDELLKQEKKKREDEKEEKRKAREAEKQAKEDKKRKEEEEKAKKERVNTSCRALLTVY